MAEENEAVAVTGRPNDTPIVEPQPAPLGGNSTFAERAKARTKPARKQVDDEDTENKSVSSTSRRNRK